MTKKIVSWFFLFSWIGIVLILFPFNYFWTFYDTYINFYEINKNNYLDIYEELKTRNPKISENSLSRIVNKYADAYGISHWKNWINSLTYHPWNSDNFYSTSESQSLYLYANEFGDFWNVPLHKQQQPKNAFIWSWLCFGKWEVRGGDWKYLNKALIRAVNPDYLVVYHGVEFMEDEFWDQLKNYVVQPNGYAWKNAIGKTIESYGFISTTFMENHAASFVDGFNWTNGSNHLPLKEPALFKIYIPKGAKGAGYVSGFSIAGLSANLEAQIIFKKDCSFKITNWQKDGDTNVFSMTYLG